MTHDELKRKFEVAGVTARDFIRWAAAKGVRVHDSTVSRHLSGKQGITEPWVLGYGWFFEERRAGSAPDERINPY